MGAPARVRVRDKEGKRRALLRAATEVFGELGYEAAPTKEIARRAGCSESLIFRYFVDKQGIFEQVVSEQVARAVADAEEDLVQSPPPTLREFIEQLFAVRPAPAGAQAIAGWDIASRALSDPSFSMRVFLPNHQARVALIADGVRHYQELGQVDRGIAAQSYAELLANVTIYTTTLAPRLFGTSAADIRTQVELAVDVLTAGAVGATSAKPRRNAGSRRPK
jgi:AcrR family transcriptional regulator